MKKRSFKNAYNVLAVIGINLTDVGLTGYNFDCGVVFAESKSAAVRRATKQFKATCEKDTDESLKICGPYDYTEYTLERVYIKKAGETKHENFYDDIMNRDVNVWGTCQKLGEFEKRVKRLQL